MSIFLVVWAAWLLSRLVQRCAGACVADSGSLGSANLLHISHEAGRQGVGLRACEFKQPRDERSLHIVARHNFAVAVLCVCLTVGRAAQA